MKQVKQIQRWTRVKRGRGVVTALSLAVGMAGALAAQSVPAVTPNPLRQASAKPAANGPVPLPSPLQAPRYQIKRQDVLAIAFPLSPELNQTITVQPDGYINLNGAPSLHVEGLTVPQLETALKDDYAATLNHPIITVDLKDFQKPFFTVSGQVGKPGQYELRSDINVAEAVAQAGGLASTARYQVFVFHRSSPDYYTVEKVDLKRLMKGKNLNDTAMIRPGDMILVPESGITTFRKYVPYSLGASYFPTN